MTINNIINLLPAQIRLSGATRVSGFDIEDFKSSVIGHSDSNEYIPVVNYLHHDLLEINNNTVLEYSKPLSINRVGDTRRYDTLFSRLFNANYPGKFTYKLGSEIKSLFYHRGMIYTEQGDILLCLAINTNYAMSANTATVQVQPDNKKFLLFISDKFSEPDYKNIKKKLETTYIANCKLAGIDVLNTSRIEDWLYSNNYEAPRFKSVIELNKHLKEDIPQLLLDD